MSEEMTPIADLVRKASATNGPKIAAAVKAQFLADDPRLKPEDIKESHLLFGAACAMVALAIRDLTP